MNPTSFDIIPRPHAGPAGPVLERLAPGWDADDLPVRGMLISPTAMLVAFWLVTLALLAAHLGRMVQYAYPAAALGVGWLLLTRAPRHYVSFVWLLWFFTPSVRRMIDLDGGFDATSLAMLAPYLATALSGLVVLKHSRRWREPGFVPFLLVFAGVGYAFAIGVGGNGFYSPTYDSLEWLVPPVFAAWMLLSADELHPLEPIVQRTFAVGLLVMGAYGVIQFVRPSAWDVAWMKAVPMASNGTPEPFGVRVFSTMNSPGPFALMAMGLLVVVPSSRGLLRWLALGPGVVAFLLSLVRSAWGGWTAAVAFIAVKAGGRMRARLLGMLLGLSVVGLPLLTIGPVADQVGKRLESFDDIRSDNSFAVRMEMYATFAQVAFFHPVGAGLGSTGTATKLTNADNELGDHANFDSGIMNLPFVLGWPGVILYGLGLVSLLSQAVRRPELESNFFLCSCAAAAVGAVSQLVFINTLIGVQGMVFWGLLGTCLAAGVEGPGGTEGGVE